jgi:NAD(P)H-dependent FMN reductase
MVSRGQMLLISGSLRRGSTNTAVLLTAQAVAPAGVETVLYDGLDRLPHFNPDDDVEPLHPEVAAFRAAVNDADAVLFSTPEYAGALPGSLKNLLDWTVGDGESSGKPVGWINASASPHGAAGAHDSLRTVVTYTDWAVVDEACARVPVSRGDLGPDGLVTDAALRAQIADVVAVLARRAAGH